MGLPFFNRLNGFGTRRPIQAIAQINSAAAGASSITCPTVIAGDLIVVLSYAVGSGAFVTPSGFTAAVQSNNGTDRQQISFKISDGTESGSTLNGMTGSGFGMIVATFRGSEPFLRVEARAASGEVTNGDPVAQNVLAGAIGGSGLVIAGYASTGTVSPRTMSPAKDGEIGLGTNNGYLAWKAFPQVAVDVSVDMEDEGNSNALQSVFLSLGI